MARLSVELVGDSRALERAFARSSRSATRFKRDIDRIGRGGASRLFSGLGRQVAFASAGFLGGAGLVAAFKSTVSAASDLQEQISKTNVVFGESAAGVEAWSKTLVESAGLSERAALGIASSFGALFRPMGIGQEQAAGFSEQLTQLGADLASFYNTDVTDALEAIQSGLVGQVRPLRRYAVQLSAARVEAEALRVTGKKSRTELTEQEKTLARLAIIFTDTKLAQGDFARTSGHLANQQRILQANIEHLQESLGVALVPVLTRVVQRFNDWFARGDNAHRLTVRFRKVVEGLAKAAGAAATLLGDVVGALGGWGNALTVAIGAWAGFKVAGVTSATAVLVANVAAAEGVAAAWKAALLSTGWGIFAVAAGIAAAYVIKHWERVRLWFDLFWRREEELALEAAQKIAEPFSHIPDIPGFGPSKLGRWARDLKDAAEENLPKVRSEIDKTQAKLDQLAGKLARPGQAPAGARGPVGPKKRSPQVAALADALADARAALRALRGDGAAADLQKESARAIQALQLGLDRAQLTSGLADDLAALERLQSYLRKRIRVEKKNLDLRQQLVGVESQILEVQKQQREQAAARREARQFRQLGFGPTGEALIPGIDLLQRRLEGARRRILGTFLDTRKTRGLLGNIRRVLSGDLGEVGRDVRQKVAEILADLNRQLKDQQNKVDVTGFKHTTAGAILAGLGLNPRQREALRVRLAMVGPGGTVPSASRQFTGGVTINGGLHLHGVQDVKGLENALAKRRKQRAHPRRPRS